MEYYNTLGVEKTANQDEIKKAYRKLASQHHPDKGGDTAKFQKIQAAYETLSDSNKRAEYDNPRPQMPGGFPGGFNFGGGPGNPFESIFEQMFRQNGRPQQPQQQLYRTTIWVTLEQVYSGGEQVLQLQSPTSGARPVKITIPKGVPDGGQVRLENVIEGGTLVAEFRIHPHLRFTRERNDLVCNHQISVLDLIIGTSFEFTTLSGTTLEVTIPPKTQPFHQMKIAGYGLPIPGTGGVGDQIILLKPFVPGVISDQVIEAIRASKNIVK